MARAWLNKDYWHSKAHEFRHDPYYRSRQFWLILLVILLLFVLLWHFLGSKNKKQQPPPQPVVMSLSKSADIPIYLSALLGSVSPFYTVTVKTQINGQLLHVYYKEGQLVKAGDLLAEIDPRPYLALLAEYKGQLARDKALLVNAQLDLKRYQTLWKQDSVSKQTLDTQASLVNQYLGAVALDEGLIQTTLVNLIYCRITSPIDGRIGLRLVDPGNFVQTSDTTGLAVITTVAPINVIFPIAEDDVPAVMEQIHNGKTLTVEAYDRQQVKLLATGQLLTIDNQINSATGTVNLKAQFQNSDDHLFPNQFVSVKLLVKTLNKITVVPTAAIQFSTQGAFVYVVNMDNTVSVKPVTTSVTTGDNTAIQAGITPGQAVVVEGADKLTDGMKVTVASPNTQQRIKA